MSAPRPELVRLLDAGKREPDDDHARLVLADWLEEFGDEDDGDRAAFVRLQVSSGPENGRPDFAASLAGWWNLALKRWARFSSGLFQALPRRGLVSARVSAKAAVSPKAGKTATTEAWAWVEQLCVFHQMGDVEGWLESPLLDSASDFTVERANLAELGPAGLAKRFRAGWRSLTLRDCYCDEGLMSLFGPGRAEGLVSLDLSSHYRMDGFEQLLATPDALPRLGRLALPRVEPHAAEWTAALTASRRRFTSFSAEVGGGKAFLRGVADADSCAGLRRLRLSRIVGEFKALPSLRCWSTLEELRVEDSNLTPPAGWLADCPDAPRLRHVSFRDSCLKAAAVRALARSPALASLTSLDLSQNRFGPAGAAALTACPAAPLSLNLARCQVQNDGLLALARWPGLARCRVLDLTRNDLTLAGIAALVASPHAAGLVGLRLSSNRLDHNAVARLVRADWLPNLEQLHLDGNLLGPAAAAHLGAAPLTNLRELVVRHQGVASDELFRALPHVRHIE